MRDPESCDRRGCSRPVTTTLCEEALCLDHFCSRSYEMLNAMDRRNRLKAALQSPTAEQIKIADECARKALGICMSKMLLNNLERARLLDILLWCGDVVNSTGPRKLSPPDPLRYADDMKNQLCGGEISSGTSSSGTSSSGTSGH
jgi:hypothetical protein